MVLASDPTTLTTPIVISDGGTGATTASAARLNLGITSFADAIVTATTGASVRTTIGAAASGANSDITSLSGLTTPITVAQGGTGATTQTSGYLLKGNGSAAVSASVIYDTGTNVGIGTTSPGAKFENTGRTRLGASVSPASPSSTDILSTAVAAISGNGGNYLSFGQYAGGGPGYAQWIQSSYLDPSTATYSIVLQPVGGSVAIGRADAARKFDVEGGGRFLQDTAATTGAIVLRQNSGDTVGGFIQWVNNANSAEKGWMVVDTSSNMIFAPNSSEAMRLTSAGKVAVGTTAVAGGQMQINGQVSNTDGTGLDQGQLLITDSDNATTSGMMLGYRFQTSVAEYGRIQCRNAVGAINLALQAGGGNVGIGTSAPTYKLEVAGDVRIASGGDLRISAAASGNDMSLYNDSGDLYFNNGTQRMFLSAAGNLAVGNNITAGGDITATGNVTAYSDARLKTDLTRIEGALDKVEKLAGYTFTRVDSGERQTGLLAQDVQAVLPEAVVDGEHLAVAYGNMMGLVVEAIKELRADFEELRQQAVKVTKG